MGRRVRCRHRVDCRRESHDVNENGVEPVRFLHVSLNSVMRRSLVPGDSCAPATRWSREETMRFGLARK
jgi:hypothetical protein